MKENKKRLIISIMAIALLISLISVDASANAQVMQKKSKQLSMKAALANETNRLAGKDRYETAIAIAKEYGAPKQTAILVSGENYPDALCVAPLASAYNAPVLLTNSEVLTPSTLQALKDLKVNKVVIVGGTVAVSEKVENAIKTQSISTERIAGRDRYDTSAKIAYKYEELRGELPEGFVVASGEGFADALSITPVSVSDFMPILLTKQNSLPSYVQDYIDYINKNKKIRESFVIGGDLVISDGVKNKLPNCIRLGGNDRFETNIKVLQHFELDYELVYLASGLDYADALTGGFLAGNTCNPMILVGKTIPAGTNDYLGKRLTGLSRIVAFGGTKVVPDSIISDVKKNICQDGIDVANDTLELKIGYAEGDSAESVTQNLTLPTKGSHGSTIYWESNNKDIISNTGVVTRPTTDDVTVEFDVFVEKGELRCFERFTVVVKKK